MIECCGKMQSTRAFMCDAPAGFIYQRIEFLTCCSNCATSVCEVVRVDSGGVVSRFRRTNKRARELFEKLRTTIQYKIPRAYSYSNNRGKFYLNCNEFGRKTRCYSNLSSLKNVGESLDLPQNRVSF